MSQPETHHVLPLDTVSQGQSPRTYEALLEQGANPVEITENKPYSAAVADMQPLDTVDTTNGPVGLLGVLDLSYGGTRLEVWGALDEAGQPDMAEVAVTPEGFDPQNFFLEEPTQPYHELQPGTGMGIGQQSAHSNYLLGGHQPRSLSRRHAVLSMTEEGELQVIHLSKTYPDSTFLVAPGPKIGEESATSELDITQPRPTIPDIAGQAAVAGAVEPTPVTAEKAAVSSLELPPETERLLGEQFRKLLYLQETQDTFNIHESGIAALERAVKDGTRDVAALEVLMAAGALFDTDNYSVAYSLVDNIQDFESNLTPDELNTVRQLMHDLGSARELPVGERMQSFEVKVSTTLNYLKQSKDNEAISMALEAFGAGVTMADQDFKYNYWHALQYDISQAQSKR